MKHIKTYKIFESSNSEIVNDILLDLNDDGVDYLVQHDGYSLAYMNRDNISDIINNVIYKMENLLDLKVIKSDNSISYFTKDKWKQIEDEFNRTWESLDKVNCTVDYIGRQGTIYYDKFTHQWVFHFHYYGNEHIVDISNNYYKDMFDLSHITISNIFRYLTSNKLSKKVDSANYASSSYQIKIQEELNRNINE